MIMDTFSNNIVMNSCQYTPVYFIENPGVSQARSYVITPCNQSAEKPVSESLKRFYENSGKLETNLNTIDNNPKPKIFKKQESIVRNNLKLASFLLPKSENKTELSKQIITPLNNVVLKPVYIANNINTNNINTSSSTPKLDVNSKIVQLKDLPNIVRCQNGKILPKIKPKENSSATLNKQKHTAVQLVKLGETYHSLNQLSNDQMKIVNHALKIFNNPQSTPPEPAYDPVTNTKFIYKVVSPKDFAVGDKNKVNRFNNEEIKKETIKVEKPEIIEEEPQVPVETKVTRSGRVVKLPKTMIPEDSPSKPKKKNGAIVSCLQCTTKFSSPQRLHRHYENHPSHLPSKLHNNLFHCLLAIVKAGSDRDQANVFIQQLEHFIKRLKSSLPCMLKTVEGSEENSSFIKDDLSKLLGINPGKYNLNIGALSCVKDKDGYCNHNPRPPSISCVDILKPKISLPEQNEKSDVPGPYNGIKIIPSERRPIILRKIECKKQKLEQSSINMNGKKMKLTSIGDTSTASSTSNLTIDDLAALLSDKTKTDSNVESNFAESLVLNNEQGDLKQNIVLEKPNPKPPHIQFHSAHFDIRSSPIKPTSTVFRKFQINPEKMAKYDEEIIQPIKLNQLAQDNEISISNSPNVQIFNSTNEITNKKIEEMEFASGPAWPCAETSTFIKPNELINDQTNDFMKSNDLIESELLFPKDSIKSSDKNTDHIDDFMKSNILNVPDLLNVQNSKATININNPSDFMQADILTEPCLLETKTDNKLTNRETENNELDISPSQGQSLISFLEALGNDLTFTETENRNNSVDFHMDLFSFNNV